MIDLVFILGAVLVVAYCIIRMEMNLRKENKFREEMYRVFKKLMNE